MAQQKYTNGSGVAEIWANTKNYIAAQLLGKSDVGHTHSYNDLTDKPIIPDVSNYYTKAEIDTLINNIVGVSIQEVYTMEVLSDDVSASIRVIEDDTDTSVANYSTVEQSGDVDVL